METSPYPIFVCSSNRLIFVNSSFEKLFEYSFEELTSPGFIFFDLIASNYHDPISKILREAGTKMGTTKDFNFIGIVKSGKRIHCHVTISTIFNGRPCYQGIIRDITRDILSEETLFNSRQMLRFVYDNIPQRIYLKDKNCIYFSANKQFLKDVNFGNEEEIIGLSDKDLPWKDYADSIWEEDQKVLLGEIYTAATQNYIINNKLSIRKNVKFPLKNKNGDIIGILGSYEDITEIFNFNAAILSSEKRYRSVFNNPHFPLLLIDPDNGKIIEANTAACSYYGYSLHEFTKMEISDLNSMPDEKLREALQQAIENRQNVFVMQHKKKSGELVDVELHSGPITFDYKDYLISQIYDITEKTRMIEELKEAKRQAEEMNRLKSVFLANMSHELRTPLVGILGYSQIIMDEAENTETAMMGESIYKGGNRLLDTLNLILDLSRIEANRMEINYVIYDVSEIVREVYSTFSSAAKLKNILFICSIQEEPIFVKIDVMHLTSILNNLVHNSIKFTDNGSITMLLHKESGNAVFTVIDTGIGIPPEKQAVVFDPFRQASEGISRNFEGTGLGLTLTKKFVELMGGTITMKSKIGSGTTFDITFPLYNKNVDILETIEKENIIPEVFQTKKRILVVEDDLQNYDITSIFLQDNFICTHASNGKEALTCVRNNPYDLILMDINLGKGLTGSEVLNEIKKMPGKGDIPVIALTAFAMKQDVEEFLKKGFNQVLTKPFTKHMLRYTVEKYIK